MEKLKRTQTASRDKAISHGTYGVLSSAHDSAGWRIQGVATRRPTADEPLGSPGKDAHDEDDLVEMLAESFTDLSAAIKTADKIAESISAVGKPSPFVLNTLEALNVGITEAQALQSKLRMSKSSRKVDGQRLTRLRIKAMLLDTEQMVERLAELGGALQAVSRGRKATRGADA